MRFLRIACVLTATAAATACYGLDNLFKSPTSSTDSTSARSYLGVSTGPTVTSYPTAQSCGNARWNVTSQTGTQISGDFTATCANGMTLAGTMVATVTDATAIPWAASGTATQGSTSCPFSLTGTGAFQGTSSIVVNYAGTACGSPIAGSETIKRS